MPLQLQKIIAQNVRRFRHELNLTQKEIASRAGYKNHTSIRHIEAGQVSVPLSRLEDLAEAMGVTVWDLIFYDSNKAAIVQEILDLTEEESLRLARIIEIMKEQRKRSGQPVARSAVRSLVERFVNDLELLLQETK